MEIGSRLLGLEDKAGNKLVMRVYYDENKTDTNATLYLRLKSENRPRMLGNIDFATRTFYCKRNRAKHYHHQMKGFGFNWTVLDDNYLNIQKIHLLVDDSERYVFNKSLIKDYGKFLNFKQQGFELQRFINFELIKNFKKEAE